MYLLLSKHAVLRGDHAVRESELISDFLVEYFCGFMQPYNKELYCIFFILYSSQLPRGKHWLSYCK